MPIIFLTYIYIYTHYVIYCIYRYILHYIPLHHITLSHYITLYDITISQSLSYHLIYPHSISFGAAHGATGSTGATAISLRRRKLASCATLGAPEISRRPRRSESLPWYPGKWPWPRKFVSFPMKNCYFPWLCKN